jgi:hypothetical protein
MRIVNLHKEDEQDYFICLEEWAEYMKEAGTKKQEWYECYRHKGLRVKLAFNDEDVLVGFIQYLPIEHSIIEGHDLYFILCIWVHGHPLGRGNQQKLGIGSELLKAAEIDVIKLGAKGISAWGLSAPFWMQAAWFEKYGYKRCDEDHMSVLVWKKFADDAEAPRWMRQKKAPELTKGKVTISLFNYGWCPSQNITYERTLQVAKEFGNKVKIKEYDTKKRDVMEEWGLSDAIFIDDEMVNIGPPIASESIRELIQKKIKN